MKDKQRKQFNSFFDKLDKAAAKHLVRLGVEKDWRDVYRRMQKRRRKNERST
jgi:hypothetical protein|tara:strand:+ start:2194 stop:2349 length:156 start_codon:yes stop_codon:yes gene_type:complete